MHEPVAGITGNITYTDICVSGDQGDGDDYYNYGLRGGDPECFATVHGGLWNGTHQLDTVSDTIP